MMMINPRKKKSINHDDAVLREARLMVLLLLIAFSPTPCCASIITFSNLLQLLPYHHLPLQIINNMSPGYKFLSIRRPLVAVPPSSSSLQKKVSIINNNNNNNVIITATPGQGRHLLQVTTDSVAFSVLVVGANDTTTTQAAILNANATVEGFTSSAPPVFVPASCPANSISPEGSISVTQCSCLPGYEGNASNGTDCAPCPIDTFCASGKLGLCPANAYAPALSDSILDCTCYPGFYGNGSVACTRCPANTFCIGGFAPVEACTLNAVSPPQSTSPSACYCDRGFYGVNNTQCKLCKAGSWCWTGIMNPCPNNSSSPQGSSRISQCVCLDGLEDTPIMDNLNETTSVCTVCHENAYCKVIPVYMHTHTPQCI